MINSSLTKSRYIFITINLKELQQNNPLTVTDYQGIWEIDSEDYPLRAEDRIIVKDYNKIQGG